MLITLFKKLYFFIIPFFYCAASVHDGRCRHKQGLARDLFVWVMSHYETLGVAKDADAKAIKRAYRKLAVKWHPDRNRENQKDATAEFQRIGEAYSILSDPNERAAYDRHLRSGRPARSYQSGGGNGGGGARGGGGFQGGMPGGIDPEEIFRVSFIFI